ncbi:hypothetical protein ENBRE01_0081 [Enteropsectra breve]|nr:hypothetical protein ENBRE01_0081 [Enteropsectra breve]
MDLGERWKYTIFSDEKKFNLDGPDGYAYYWHAVGSSSPVLAHRAFGGGSIMVWACFDFFGKSELAFLEGGIDGIKYQSVLNNHLLPFLALRDNGLSLFQQDNARPHIAKSNMTWLEANGIECMEWPAYFPDLNPIENLWGI